MNVVVAPVEDPATRDTVSVNADRLAFTNPPLRDELAPEPVVPFDVPFRSVSKSSLHDLLGQAPVEQTSKSTPTPFHDPTPPAGSLDFLDQPRAEGKRNVRRNRDQHYAYFLISRRDMAASEYSRARHHDIRRQ